MSDIDEDTSVSVRTHRINDKPAVNQKRHVNRIRKRLNITISPENYKFIKEKLTNASKVIDNFITSLRTGKLLEVYVFEKIEGLQPPSVRARSLARSERPAHNRAVEGSNPSGPIQNPL